MNRKPEELKERVVTQFALVENFEMTCNPRGQEERTGRSLSKRGRANKGNAGPEIGE